MKLFAISLLMLLAACTSQSPIPSPGPIVCSIEQSMADGLASTLAQSLQCSAKDVISKDLLGVLGKANLCVSSEQGKAPMKGIIGSIACPLVVDSALGLVNAQIPAAWSCKLSKAPGTVGELLNTACQSLVKF
jgi:hypothetical protein